MVVSVPAILCALLLAPDSDRAAESDFPATLLDWRASDQNPLFTGSGKDTWDKQIRERGFILRDQDRWHFWYTGYNLGRSDLRLLGYATSPDGITWTRHGERPLLADAWVEDMHVVKHNGTFTMVAEGRGDVAHLLTSQDGVHWKDYQKIDLRKVDGTPISAGPYGTPTLLLENGTWYLFYERGDRGVWLAKSRDKKVWTNVQDDPVIPLGPDAYDRYAIALNQVIPIDGRYYALYHANADPRWRGDWRMCLAVSDDLIHWKKYPQNPILPGDYSSGQLVHDGKEYRLYTPHPFLRVYFNANSTHAQ